MTVVATVPVAAPPVAPPVDVEEWDPDAWPRARLSALQTELNKRGYHCGECDGRIGTETSGAIAKFEHDCELDITGLPSDSMQEALWSADLKPIPDDRASGTPAGSTIVANASTAAKVAVAGAAAMTADGASTVASTPASPADIANQALSVADQAQGFFQRAVGIASNFGFDLKGFALGHPLHIAAIVAMLYVAWKHWAIIQARIADYRSGKTL